MSPDGPADITGGSPRTPAEPLPEEIGRYRILASLGTGGMGTVYKAHDPQLDRVVALKLPHFLGPPRDRALLAQRFQREARAAAQVWHPHVCPIYDVGEHDGQPYVVMACLDGESLADRLTGQRRVDDVGQAVALARQVLDALEAVHGRGIIHRDLKPGNIIIGPGGKAVLTDFGLARPEKDTEHLTSEGVVVGTPAYMAPEQAGGESGRVGPWTDLYSLGVVLYQMLTGCLPFEGPPLTVLAKIVNEPPPPPSRFRPDLDRGLEAALLKALVKEPRERYQTARHFAESLDACLIRGGMTGGAATVSPPAATPTKDHPAPQKSAATTSALPAAAGARARQRLRLAAAGCLAAGILLLAGCVLTPLLIMMQGGPPMTMAARGGAFSGRATATPVIKPDPALSAALLTAAAKGQSVNVQDLLRRGADLDASDDLGETALIKAAAAGHDRVVTDLCRFHETKVNAKDSKGETALMKAAENGHTEVVQVLLSPRNAVGQGIPFPPLVAREVEVNEEDNQGQTALAKAKAKGHTQIVEMLKKAGAHE
jgi:hypothetical protein